MHSNSGEKRLKRRIAWTLVVLLFAGSVIGIVFGLGSIEDIAMSESDIQAKLSEKLPATQKGITIESIALNLDNDMIHLTVEVNGEKFKQPFEVTAEAIGELDYESTEGAFYFTPYNIEIADFTVRDKTVAEGVVGFINKWVDADKIESNKEVIGGKVEQWATRSVEKAVAWGLKRFPVYTLPDDFKGNVARIALDSVEVKDGNVIAHLSVWKLGGTIILYGVILLAAIGFVVAMIRNPRFGVAVLETGADVAVAVAEGVADAASGIDI